MGKCAVPFGAVSTLRSVPRAVVAFSLLAGLIAGSCTTGTSDTRVLEVGVGEVPPAQSSAQPEGGSAAVSRAASASLSESLSGSASADELLAVASDVDSSRASSMASLVAEISNSQSRRASQLGELTSTVRGAIVATPPGSTMTTLAASTRAPVTTPAPAASLSAAASAPATRRATAAATTATSTNNGAITLAPHQSLVATAAVAKVAVYSAPGSKVVTSLRNPQSSGFPLVFLAVKDTGDWLQVYLPIRPNGSTGWIKKRDVSLTYHDYRIVVELSAHRLTVLKAGVAIMTEPIGVGTSNAPTPGGFFYTKEILKVPNPGGPYGPFAYGLSGFSDVYETFGSGPGTIGIHGTNDPSSLGRDVSHGCIRLNNSAITKMAGSLPIGVPVEIRP